MPRSSTLPTTLIWLAMMSPALSSTTASSSSELTTIPPPSTSIPPPSTSSAPSSSGSSTQSTQLLGAAGPAPAAALALMLLVVLPSRGANAYRTTIGGVVTWSAFASSGQMAPGSGTGTGSGMVQQTTSPFPTSPSFAQSASAGSPRPPTFRLRNSSTVPIAATPPSDSSDDAPARAAESAAVWAEVRVAQFSPMSTTRAAKPSSTVNDSATVMATLPRSDSPRPRNIVGHRPRSGTRQPVRDEPPRSRGYLAGTLGGQRWRSQSEAWVGCMV